MLSSVLAGCASPPLPPPPLPPRADAVTSIAPLRQAPTGLQVADAHQFYVTPEAIKPQDAQLSEVRRHEALIRAGQETKACMNVPAARCLASLATVARVRIYSQPEESLFGDRPPDVTGRPDMASRIELGVLTNAASTHGGPVAGMEYGVALNIGGDPGREVQGVVISLFDANIKVIGARTEEEFDQSQIYDIFQIAFARNCPDLDRKKLYEFIYLEVFGNRANENVAKKNYVRGEFCGYRTSLIIDSQKILMTRHQRYLAEKNGESTYLNRIQINIEKSWK
ncbi:hypothetical protein [Azospirillum sp. B4]|uniref:hypothetical protein n=1 Tax=Azospirillum sp. B4 TaxID=95605 RepID=UPI0011DD3130|nr:hypothetical protein [Azospirillum sp. B4]